MTQKTTKKIFDENILSAQTKRDSSFNNKTLFFHFHIKRININAKYRYKEKIKNEKRRQKRLPLDFVNFKSLSLDRCY
jgi:hypothetical protein